MQAINEKFIELGAPRRIWAVAAVQGDYDRLATLHDNLAKRFGPRDRLVYMGNYLGAHSVKNRAVFEEILAFRAALLAKSGMEPQDIVYLRGLAEEAWQRLLRLQFAPQPVQTLEKLIASGIEPWLQLCGVSLNDTRTVARAGSLAITRWTNQLRQAQRMTAGLEAMMCGMRRAAILRLPEQSVLSQLLFVPASYDFSRCLEDQGEHLWWSDRPYDPAAYLGDASHKVVRGFDAARGGIQTDGLALTLDGGCGSGGPLVCGCFNAAGQLLEIITVGGQQAGQFAGELNRAARSPAVLRMPLHQSLAEPTALYA
jgi:hypothetical protein